MPQRQPDIAHQLLPRESGQVVEVVTRALHHRRVLLEARCAQLGRDRRKAAVRLIRRHQAAVRHRQRQRGARTMRCDSRCVRWRQ